MPRRNRNVAAAPLRTPLDLLSEKATRRINRRTRRKGRAA